MRRVIVYIDGFNLYFGMRAAGWRRYYWLDVEALARNLLKPDQLLAAVKYFTARVVASPSKPDKQRRQTIYLEALMLLPNTTLHYGHYLSKPVRCRSCGSTWNAPEEKMTDVNIAVEMFQDATDDTFDVAILISADSDLAAPVAAVRRRHPGKVVIVVAPPRRNSDKLRRLASGSFQLSRAKLAKSQLRNSITKPDGHILQRPEHWK